MPAAARRALVGLGSNLGDRLAHLQGGVDALPDVVAASAVYETDPVGPPGQGPYLNAVVELRTPRSPRQLLAAAHAAEGAAGRVRTVRWGPRTLDVDLLALGDDGEEVVDEPDLVVPHPRLWDRPFVVVPLADLAPGMVERRLGPRWREAPGSGVAGSVRPTGMVLRTPPARPSR